MASGAIRKTTSGFLIGHYQLSIAAPNGIARQLSSLVRSAEAQARQDVMKAHHSWKISGLARA